MNSKRIQDGCDVTFINADCFDVMGSMKRKGFKVDMVLTSPPYNTGRTVKTQRGIDNYENRYDIHLDNMTDEEYLGWTKKLFDNYDEILNENGVILYNVSYGSESPDLMWRTVNEIIVNTNFMIADNIIWKKKSALPNNVSPNKLTRITEYVFVICRKDEYKTFNTNKKVKSKSKTGQSYYENIFNFIEAKNNDGSCKLNKATFSSDLVLQLLDIYANKDTVVYDSFMGTGTTAIGCIEFGARCIGSELSEGQYEYSINRVIEKIKV
jgi:site-specific DNA-methyltransferase (adenine-specific)